VPGVYLPLQDEILPHKEHFGQVFYRNNAHMSSMGITQIAAVMEVVFMVLTYPS
jgi:3-methylcrotonyl-CoA carboxylase beta subunit